jgi:hypothetical protein
MPMPDAASHSHRYCLVGAGPSGLVMARALIAEGVDFDWFERHSDVGGIWDLTNPGTPMYENCHFISSKFTSGFYGHPMPDELPDYPSWRDIREYIRNFAHNYDLTKRVTFDTAVARATPLSKGSWEVTLSDGRIRQYDGLIVAPGVTWHPSSPTLPGAAEFTGEIWHSNSYVSPHEFVGKRVVIVGCGNSGADIACDAAANATEAYLSVRRGYRFLPKHIFGYPTDAVLDGHIPFPRMPAGVVLPENEDDLIDMLVGDLTRLGLPAPDHDLLTSHPIMNTQVLHYLGHGDLAAKPDVERLSAAGVHFKDGTVVDADLVLFATGYRYDIPFLDRDIFLWKNDRPQLYMNIFSREHDSLYVLGFIEFADAAYKRFDEMASLIRMDIHLREEGGERDATWRQMKQKDFPDLRGGKSYLDSPRHSSYVDSETFQQTIKAIHARFGWPTVDEQTYTPSGAAAGVTR